jgi:hypothetical protein
MSRKPRGRLASLTATAALVLTMLLSIESPAVAQSAVEPSAPGIFENLSLFVGPDGSKQPQDLGINAEMGIRFAANWAFPISERFNLGAQVGAASNLSDGAVNVLNQIGGPGHRTQTFVTIGVFQRPSSRVNWGVVYDTSFERYYDNFRFAQWRGQAGYGVSNSDEVGIWFAKSAHGQDGQFAGTAVRLDPISQVNAYTRHTWANHARTAVWVGVANAHGNVVWVLPANTTTGPVLVYGSELDLPLSERFAVTGMANFITPTATGSVDAFLGLTFYPGRSGFRADRNTFAPLTTVANNPTMAIDLRR